MFADIKNFKRINENFGHQAGDDVLRQVAGVLRDVAAGKGDVLRYSGDDFVTVFFKATEEHLFCSPAEIECLLSTLLRSGVHTFCAKSGHWLEPNGRHWMVLPNYDSISLDDWEDFDV